MILELTFKNYGEAGYTYRQMEKSCRKLGAVPSLHFNHISDMDIKAENIENKDEKNLFIGRNKRRHLIVTYGSKK